MFSKRLLFDRSKIYIAAPKYFCYLRYTHMNIVFVVFTYSWPDNHFVHAVYHCIHNHNFVAFESFGWRIHVDLRRRPPLGQSKALLKKVEVLTFN